VGKLGVRWWAAHPHVSRCEVLTNGSNLIICGIGQPSETGPAQAGCMGVGRRLDCRVFAQRQARGKLISAVERQLRCGRRAAI
jgi:hypothetical protein